MKSITLSDLRKKTTLINELNGIKLDWRYGTDKTRNFTQQNMYSKYEKFSMKTTEDILNIVKWNREDRQPLNTSHQRQTKTNNSPHATYQKMCLETD